MNGARKHPAETVGLAGALALLVSRMLGVSDPDVIMALGIVFASLPAVITSLVVLIRHSRPPGA